MDEYLADFDNNSTHKISERDFSLSEIRLDTTKRQDQAKGKEKHFISLYGPFHNIVKQL